MLIVLLLTLFAIANGNRVPEQQLPDIQAGQTWQNELGSVMIVDSYNSTNGGFSGQYASAVGDADGYYQMVGRKDTAGNTLGWTVVYKNNRRHAYSTCTWSGQLQLNDQGDPTILTTWLLTSQTIAVDNWKSTTVGKNFFTLKPESS